MRDPDFKDEVRSLTEPVDTSAEAGAITTNCSTCSPPSVPQHYSEARLQRQQAFKELEYAYGCGALRAQEHRQAVRDHIRQHNPLLLHLSSEAPTEQELICERNAQMSLLAHRV